MIVLSRQPKKRSIDSTVDDYEFQISCNTLCDKYCSLVWEKNDRIGKIKEKNPAKDKWELSAVIPLMQIVGVNHRLPILHMSKKMVHIYTTDKTVRQIDIGYMVNLSLHINKMFKTQVEKSWVVLFLSKQCKLLEIILPGIIPLLWHL